MLFSCQNAAKTERGLVEINVPADKEYLSNYSDFFTSIEYVLLEDSDDHPLVQPYKIVSFDSLIFVEDQELDNLLIYNRSGDFLFSLNSSGAGPQEFNQIEDYQVGENSIIIKDNVLMKFIEFDFTGNFVREYKHQLLSMNFAKTNEYQLHFFNNVIQSEAFNFLTISETDSSYVIPIQPGYEKLVLVHQNGFTKSINSAKNYLSLPFSYDVFSFDTKGELEKRLRFNFGNLGITDEQRLLFQNEQQKPSEGEFILMLRSFYPVGDQYIFNYTSNSRNVYLGVLNSDYSLEKIGENLTNDLDGVPLILVPWSYHENGVTLKLPSQRFASYVSERKPVTSMKSNLPAFVEAHAAELNSDRHVLVFLHR